MQYFAELNTGRGASRALAYDPIAVDVASVDSRVEIEKGSDFWALKINGDYSMVYDSDGLIVGDFDSRAGQDYPRLDFYAQKCGMKQRMASLSQSGRFNVPGLTESDSLGTGMNFFGDLVIAPKGVRAAKINEAWFLAVDGDYVVSNGMLIRVRKA